MTGTEQGFPTDLTTFIREYDLACGALIDISYLGRAQGFHAPLAATRAVHDRYILPPGGPFRTDAVGSVWTILHWLLVELRQAPDARAFKIFRIQDDANHATFPRLKAVAFHDANGRPSATVMLPDE